MHHAGSVPVFAGLDERTTGCVGRGETEDSAVRALSERVRGLVKMDRGKRTNALILFTGEAKRPNCAAADTSKKVKAGDSEKICSAFLVRGSGGRRRRAEPGFTSEPPHSQELNGLAPYG
ncbi:hypothetical protein [Streptomyces sp. 3N207]|uniref:hypothetical protein n=1 Tax=Streptomyces sp. 3N207 TaxID=3457417 RepID=UPI003FD5E093